jgi:Serine/threonine protein kinase
MGIVYVVYDHKLRAPFAAKTFQDEVFKRDATIRDLFRKEALAWVNLDVHENVTQAQFVLDISGKPFLFLEYVSGDLSKWIGTRRLTEDLPQVLRFAIQFCDGMIHALAKGIKAHRDIKPHNCLIAEGKLLKVTDFGLAKVLGAIESKPSVHSSSQSGDLNIHVSRTGSAAGTPHYMAPEQFDDIKHVDVRADVYSFGVMLFQMLEGRLPFLQDFERSHKSESPPALTTKGSQLAALIERCLAKKPAQRFADFIVVRGELAEIYEALTGQATSKPATGKELDAIGLSNKGISLTELGRHEEAIGCFDRAIALQPHDAGTHYSKGVTLWRLGRHEEAICCYDRAIALEPDYANAHDNKGNSLSALGCHEEAIACYDRAIALKPDNANAYSNKARVLGILRRREEAVTCCNRAIAIEPDHANAHNNKGVSLEILGRFQEALTAYQRAHELGDADAAAKIERCHHKLDETAYFNKGTVLNQLGRHEEAISCFERVIELNPGNCAAYFMKGKCLNDCGRYEEALDCYQHAIDINPQYEEAWLNRGTIFGKVGDPVEALYAFHKALEINPGYAVAWFNSGVTWSSDFRQYAKALECFEQAQRLGHPNTSQAIAVCRQMLGI